MYAKTFTKFICSACIHLQKDQDVLKELFSKVYMDKVYPLCHLASLPPYKVGCLYTEQVYIYCY